MSIRDMLDRLMAASRLNQAEVKIEVDPARLRPSDVTLQIPATDKFHNATGWVPEIPFEQTVRDLLEYWRQKI